MSVDRHQGTCGRRTSREEGSRDVDRKTDSSTDLLLLLLLLALVVVLLLLHTLRALHILLPALLLTTDY